MTREKLGTIGRIREKLGLARRGLERLLMISTLIGGMAIGERVSGEGQLRMWNYSSTPGINENKVIFLENDGDGEYLAYPFPPSMETYYETNSTPYSVAGVDLSIDKSYHCPLAGQGTIPNGTSNSVAFKIVSDFPSNTLCTANIQDENGFSNFIGDVIAYTKANSNAQGYAFVPLPLTTNASDRVYGGVDVRFVPTHTITVNGPAYAQAYFYPGTTSGIAHGDTTQKQSTKAIITTGDARVNYKLKGFSVVGNTWSTNQ